MADFIWTVPTKIRVHIRWMICRDMGEVLSIEHASTDHPWTKHDFLRALRNRNIIGMVAEHGGEIVGFMVYRLQPKKIHVLNFGVSPDHRRQGIGRQMVAKLVGKLGPQRRTRIVLAVRETALGAQKFFRSQGFLATSVLPGLFEDTDEDAYVMRYILE